MNVCMILRQAISGSCLARKLRSKDLFAESQSNSFFDSHGSCQKIFDYDDAERPQNSRVMSEKPLPIEEPRKPVLDHDGKPYSPAQILALQRTELTRLRVQR